MKKVNIFTIKGKTEEDNKAIMNCYNNQIEMTIDEYGRIYNEGGIYIADAEEVEAGEGIGCIFSENKMITVKISGYSASEGDREFEVLNRQKLEKMIDNLNPFEICKECYNKGLGYHHGGTAITYIDARDGEVKSY